MSSILHQDILHTLNGLSDAERAKFQDSTVLITGCGGFLGYFFMNFFCQSAETLGIKKIIGLDNFMLGHPAWIDRLAQDSRVEIKKFDIIRDRIDQVEGAGEAQFIIHMASIASPMFYRSRKRASPGGRLCQGHAHRRQWCAENRPTAEQGRDPREGRTGRQSRGGRDSNDQAWLSGRRRGYVLTRLRPGCALYPQQHRFQFHLYRQADQCVHRSRRA